MPGGDRTGPMGIGPMTGRAAGYCAGYALPGYANAAGGRGLGGGRGGRGRRNRFYATGLTGWQRVALGQPVFGGIRPPAAWDPGVLGGFPKGREQEAEVLKQQAEYLGHLLDDVKRRLERLEPQPEGA